MVRFCIMAIFKLEPVFNCHTLLPDFLVDQDSGSDSETETLDSLTLEYRDNPFASFIRKLEQLIEIDPREALYMAGNALLGRTFSKSLQMEKLNLKMTEILDHMREEKEPAPIIAPDLQSPFARSLLNMAAPPLQKNNPSLLRTLDFSPLDPRPA